MLPLEAHTLLTWEVQVATRRLVQGVWPSGVVIAPLLGYPYAGSQKERELSYFISLCTCSFTSPFPLPFPSSAFPFPRRKPWHQAWQSSLSHTQEGDWAGCRVRARLLHRLTSVLLFLNIHIHSESQDGALEREEEGLLEEIKIRPYWIGVGPNPQDRCPMNVDR